jgi:Holliday junction resolvasome RuvABC ATP-dependent DNA helicase subunit
MIDEKEEKDYFENIIGQDSIKARLTFFIENYRKTFRLPAILVLGGFGNGKTTICRSLCRQLFEKDNPSKIKLLLEVHGNEYQTKDDVMTKLVIPYLSEGCYTLFVDECHAMGLDAQETFLKLIPDPNNPSNIAKYHYEGNDYQVNFNHVSVIMASTEGQELLGSFKSRFEILEMDEYEENDLQKIFLRGLNKFCADKEIVPKIITHVKNNPRAVANLAKNVSDYLQRENKNKLTIQDWPNLYHGMQLRPNGLDSIQIKIMKILKKHPHSSLSKVASMLELTPDACRRHHELYLMKLGYLNVKAGAGRSLSSAGIKYLQELDKIS